MPLPLHKVPSAVMELMRLKTLGRAPDEFGSVVVPVMEVGDSYACQSLLTSGGTPAVGALLPSLAATLTTTADLRFRGFSCELTIGAAAATNVSVTIALVLPGTSLVASIIASDFFAQVGIGGLVGCGVMCPPITLRTGSRIIARVTGTAAGADHTVVASGLIEFTPP